MPDGKKTIDLLGGKIITYLQYHDAFSNAVQEARNKELDGIKDIGTVDILHYLNWETPRLGFMKQEFKSGVYADDNSWHRKVRKIYSDIVDLNADEKTWEYTKYILGLDVAIFFETANKEGINVNQPVRFEEEPNGTDINGDPNYEYTIIGIIGT